MKPYGDPLDVLDLEIRLSNIMESVDGFSEAYAQYESSRRSNSGSDRPNRYSAHRLGTEHPILVQIYNTRQAVWDFYSSGRLEFNDQVQDTITTGRALSQLQNTSIVTPDDEPVSNDLESVFGERLWKEDDYWDTVFELEIAATLERGDFNPHLVDEQNQTGPDVIVQDNGSDVWWECKRKRTKTKEEREQNWAIKEILDQLYAEADLDEDSLALELRGVRFLTADDVDDVVEAALSLVRPQNLDSVAIEGGELEIELVDYFSGMRETSITPEWAEAIGEQINLGHAVDLFGHLDYEIDTSRTYGHAEAQMKVSDDGVLSVVNAYMFGVDCSEEIDYVNWAMEPIKTARKKLTGHAPGVILVDIPTEKLNKMQEMETTDHKGNTVSLVKRLEQRIIGQLADSDTISAICITSRESNVESGSYHSGRRIWCIENIDPGVELSDDLLKFLKGE